MKCFNLTLLALVFAGAASCSSTSGSAAAMDEQAMMAKMIEYGTTGEAHRVLDQNIGLWKMQMSAFNPDGTPAMSSTATSKVEWIMDGHYVQETVTGDFGGMPFHGSSLLGFDNIKQRYVGTWIDNWSTGVMTMEGTYDPKTKTLTMISSMPEPMSWSYVEAKTVSTWIDQDHGVAKFYMPGPDGNDYMHMQLDYTRTSQ